ncbi:MAG TPA: alpha/beta hydrolase [Steroidobacteraceae bacterium]|nr:alpha/beta hydrolase [Steroidobacteraceae bacterium]
MSDCGFVRVDGRQIEYQSVDSNRPGKDRPVIVMLHEGLGSVSMWKDFPVDLAEATGARVVAYSRFGYGRSERPATPHTALTMHEREALDALPRVLQALDIEQPVLFGHSDGASIALIYAGSRPDEVAGVIALAPHAFVEDMCVASIELARQSYLETNLPQKLARYHEDPDYAFWLWNDVWLDPAFRAWNIEHHLSSITCPVLAIQGYDDEYGTMEQLERLVHRAPQTELLKLDECRHSPHRDRPREVLGAVERFIQRLPV